MPVQQCHENASSVYPVSTIKYGLPHCRLMWFAGIFAAISSIIYPAISALVSKNAAPEQQGVALGILTGMRGLCNGLGPAIFGFLFWMFHVNLGDVVGKGTVGLSPGQVSIVNSSMSPLTETVCYFTTHVCARYTFVLSVHHD